MQSNVRNSSGAAIMAFSGIQFASTQDRDIFSSMQAQEKELIEQACQTKALVEKKVVLTFERRQSFWERVFLGKWIAKFAS